MKYFPLTMAAFLVLGLASCQNAPTTQTAQSDSGAAAESKPAPEKPKPVVHETELPAGTAVQVRLDQALSTKENKEGDKFAATLSDPVMANGKEILPKGSRFSGHVTTADSSGRLQGRGVLEITLDSFERNGQSYPVASSVHTSVTEDHKKRNIGIIGGGAGLGAAIGAIAGKGKGAAIGAAAGAAAGTGVAAATGKKEVDIPAETMIQFTLKSPVKVKG